MNGYTRARSALQTSAATDLARQIIGPRPGWSVILSEETFILADWWRDGWTLRIGARRTHKPPNSKRGYVMRAKRQETRYATAYLSGHELAALDGRGAVVNYVIRKVEEIVARLWPAAPLYRIGTKPSRTRLTDFPPARKTFSSRLLAKGANRTHSSI